MRAIREGWIKREDLIIIALRQLYERYGYVKYRLSAFEDYDSLLECKSFLRDKGVIAINDASGKLLALKPDATLSIARSTRATAKSSEKLYYVEDVFRFDRDSRTYKQIKQLGMECFGKLDPYLTCEVLRLAAATLCEIGYKWVLTLSHADLIVSFLDSIGVPRERRGELTECVRQKNAHQFSSLLIGMGFSLGDANAFSAIARISGDIGCALARVRSLAFSPRMASALDEIEAACDILEKVGLASGAKLDFSLINDADYYSGLVFQGFVEGVPRSVLSGGCYGGLMRKLGRDIDAIGFAVTLDELKRLMAPDGENDVDALLIYGDSRDYAGIINAAESMANEGKRVRVEREEPEGLRCAARYRYADGAFREV